MKTPFLLCLFFPLLIFGQAQDPRPKDPCPYQLKPYYDYINTSGLKKATMVIHNHRADQAPDTLFAYTYNTSGQKIKTIRFKNNLPIKTTDIHYDSFDRPISRISNSTIKPNVVERHIIQNVYDSKGRLKKVLLPTLKILHDSIVDTTYYKRHLYSYQNGHLQSVKFILVDKLLMEETYSYNKNGTLSDLDVFTSYRSSRKQFTYDNKGNLTRIEEFLKGVHEGKMSACSTYCFDKMGRVIEDSILDGTSFPKKHYQVTRYHYNSAGQIDTMKVRFKDRKRDVVFDYLSHRLSHVTINTNTGNSAYMRYWTNSRVDSYYTYPLVYEDFFTYDDHGNLIEIETQVNGEKFKTVTYLVAYY